VGSVVREVGSGQAVGDDVGYYFAALDEAQEILDVIVHGVAWAMDLIL
jgi:hypothetical protein